MASTDLSPRARAKRDQILAGARRVFLRYGFVGAGTDAISAEAGVSKQTLYVYYPSKEDLFVDVLRELTLENPHMRVVESMEGMAPKSRAELRRNLLEIAHKMIETLMQPEYLALLRTIIADTQRFPHLGELFRATVPERAIKSLSVLLERARENGVVRDVDLEIASRMLVGPLLTYAVLDGLLVPEGPLRTPDPERIEKVVDLYMRAIA